MTAKQAAPSAFMSQQIDILHPVFLKWFARQHPKCQKVVVFDKDNTLFSTVNGRRSCHRHLVKEVLFGNAKKMVQKRVKQVKQLSLEMKKRSVSRRAHQF